ncbi:hypothetical protein V8C86DRAFT_2622995 [Haematococcus lacustris]
MSADTTAPAQSDKVKVAPSDVVLVGSGVLAAGALAGAVATYRRGSKSLVEDGINPDIRMRMIPIAVKTLMLSMAFTSMLGVAGFYGLKAAGLFSADVAELPSVREAAAMLRNPRAYIREQVQAEAQQRR